jgi:dienelactone hydrolase
MLWASHQLFGRGWGKIILAGIILAGPVRAADPNEFLVYNHYNQDGTLDLWGRLFVPLNYNPNQSYPIVLFFHGQGEIGTNNTSQVNGNIDNLLAAAKTRGFFLYAPQLKPGIGTWNNTTVDNVMRALSDLTKAYSIDSGRLYVTGLSLGGGGLWDTMARYTGGMAAAVSSCGSPPDGSPSHAPMVGKPIWAFHARNDTTVYPDNSRTRVNMIRAADGGKPAVVFPLNANPSNPYYNTGAPYYTDGSTFYSENGLRYTEYATGGHGIWGRVYNETPMYDWLLVQNNPLATASLRTGEIMLFDFGNFQVTAPDNLGRIWNSCPYGYHKQPGAVFPFAQTAAGRSTSVSLGLTQGFNFHSQDGLAGPFPTNIGTDGWKTNVGTPSKILIRGLVSAAWYRLEIYGSTTSSGGQTRYQVGSQIVDLNATNNSTNLAIFPMVAADQQGAIELSVAGAPGGGSTVGLINTLQISRAPTSLLSWRSLHGLATNGSQDLLSPAGDGVSNLLKFAFNLAPQAGNLNLPAARMSANGTSGLPLVQTEASQALTLTFVRRKESDNPGITYTPQVSTDLVVWSDLTSTPAVTSIDGTWERATYTDSWTGSARRFLRVKVSEVSIP